MVYAVKVVENPLKMTPTLEGQWKVTTLEMCQESEDLLV
jgi:hypothetical protein